jgi:hypothetical protein
LLGEGETYHCRTADLFDITGGQLDCCFAANHVRAVGKHRHTDKREAIIVPSKCGGVILFRTLGYVDRAINFIVILDGDIDIRDLILPRGNQIDTGDLGDLGQNTG